MIACQTLFVRARCLRLRGEQAGAEDARPIAYGPLGVSSPKLTLSLNSFCFLTLALPVSSQGCFTSRSSASAMMATSARALPTKSPSKKSRSGQTREYHQGSSPLKPMVFFKHSTGAKTLSNHLKKGNLQHPQTLCPSLSSGRSGRAAAASPGGTCPACRSSGSPGASRMASIRASKAPAWRRRSSIVVPIASG